MSSPFPHVRPGDRPTYDDLVSAITALYDAQASTNVPATMNALQNRLEATWQPDASVLLQPGSVTPVTRASQNATQTTAVAEATQSVTSTTFVDLTDYTVSLATTGGPVLLLANVRVSAVVTGAGLLTWGIDGSTDVAAADGIVVVTATVPASVSWLASGLAAGSHTFKVRGRVTAGSMSVVHGQRERCIAIELK